MHTHRCYITADLMRFVTAIEQRYSADHSKPLRFDLLRLLPIGWKRESEGRKEGMPCIVWRFEGGWVRKTWSPDQPGGGPWCYKPPSTHSLPISPFGFGYPLIPFLWCVNILKIINMHGEMRFVLRWVSRLYWVYNFWNGGGGIAKCVSCIMLKGIEIDPFKKKFIFWSVDYVSTVG